MKTQLVDILVILALATITIIANEMNLLGNSSEFILIPLLVIYFLGKYVGTKNSRKE